MKGLFRRRSVIDPTETGSMESGPLESGPVVTGPMESDPMEFDPMLTAPTETALMEHGPVLIGRETSRRPPVTETLYQRPF